MLLSVATKRGLSGVLLGSASRKGECPYGQRTCPRQRVEDEQCHLGGGGGELWSRAELTASLKPGGRPWAPTRPLHGAGGAGEGSAPAVAGLCPVPRDTCAPGQPPCLWKGQGQALAPQQAAPPDGVRPGLTWGGGHRLQGGYLSDLLEPPFTNSRGPA